MSAPFLKTFQRSVLRKPSVEVHIPISPSPAFFNMVQCLALSMRMNGGICRDAPIILTVGDSTIDPGLEARYPWLGPLGVEIRWVPEGFFREHSYFATGATRLSHDFRSDVVLLLDADILVAAPFNEVIRRASREGHVAGMIGPASPLQFIASSPTWESLYEHCGLRRKPDLKHEHTGWPYYWSGDEAYQYCPAYFNYGVICAPADAIRRISGSYFKHLVKLRELPPCGLIAQIALTMAIVEHGLPTRALPVRYNFPNHPMLEALHGRELPHAKLLHLKEEHQFEKFNLFDELTNVRRTIRRRDLRGINEKARRVLEKIEPYLVDSTPALAAA